MRTSIVSPPFLLLCVMALATFATACAKPDSAIQNTDWATRMNIPGLSNFYEVAPGLYRSAQPTAEGFRQAKQMGVHTVINLQTSDSDTLAAAGTGLTLVSVPSKSQTMGDAEVIAALKAIRDAQGPVLVHCRHGADRTGLTIAAYRVAFQDWAPEDARREMIMGGYGFNRERQNLVRYIDTMNPGVLKASVFSP